MTSTQTEPGDFTLHDYAPETAEMLAQVHEGLGKETKELPTLYLYDDVGSQLFDQICEQPEYYPTNTEIGIMRRFMPHIVETIGPNALVIEPGAGSGLKTRLLLENLVEPAAYVPLEISIDHLERCAASMSEQFPDLTILAVCADFFAEFEMPPCPHVVDSHLVYFPGSTIGNMTPAYAKRLLERMRDMCGERGGVLIGVDIKKDRETLEAAYNDAAGVSAAFALNYLKRLNREVDADFDLDHWSYTAEWDAQNSRIGMFVVSRRRQTVKIGGKSVTFGRGERIRTEWSYKYSPDDFAALAKRAGLHVEHVWTDDKPLFSLQFLRPM